MPSHKHCEQLGWLFIMEQFVPELLPCEFQPQMGPLVYWFEGPRWKDKKLMVVTNISTENQESKSVSSTQELPSRPQRKNLAGWFLKKKSSLRDRTKVQCTPSAAARGGGAWRRNVWLLMYIKVGLGISRTNAHSHWNPVYNAFHRFFCCGNETIRR